MPNAKYDDDARRSVHLSPHFTAGEFECKCGCGYGLNPGDVSLLLVEGLERVRAKVGRPLFCVLWDSTHETWVQAGSGCRCAAHNKEVGGVPHSYHVRGQAADVWGPAVNEIFEAAAGIYPFINGGIGRYEEEGFVHLDVRGFYSRW